eukprot:634960-Pleurochrysis_carterae.AAC.4
MHEALVTLAAHNCLENCKILTGFALRQVRHVRHAQYTGQVAGAAEVDKRERHERAVPIADDDEVLLGRKVREVGEHDVADVLHTHVILHAPLCVAR